MAIWNVTLCPVSGAPPFVVTVDDPDRPGAALRASYDHHKATGEVCYATDVVLVEGEPSRIRRCHVNESGGVSD